VNSPFGTYLMAQAGRDVEHAAVLDAFKNAFATDHPTALQLECGKTASGEVVLTQFWITIHSAQISAFPQPASFMDTPTNQDTCPASFRITAW